jgi:Fibronectin type III domain
MHMTALTKDQSSLPETRITEIARMPLRLTVIVMGLLLTTMLFLTGCGGGEETPANGGATASLSWDPVHDPSVIAYFVHYGRQSPGQAGGCAYESSMHSSVPSATVTNLDPNTVYYFAVSAYNGLESFCSAEVSILTSSF